LSWFIAAQGHETDPDCNDYLTSKWLGLIRPLVAGFDRPLTNALALEKIGDFPLLTARIPKAAFPVSAVARLH